MQPPFPSPTTEWHNETYSAIDPARPELSVAGKRVVVTGGGKGIGKEIVRAYATAGAKSIAILGRTEGSLQETKKLVESENTGVTVSTYAADMTQPADVKKAAAEIGAWDILILNAGYMNQPGPMLDVDLDEWWKTFEINVKGQMIAIQAFVPSRNSSAVIVGTSTAAVSFPTTAPFVYQGSSYMGSKLAIVKFFELVAGSFPDIHVVTLHPGLIQTDMAEVSGVPDGTPVDDIKLPAHFTVWLSSPEAAFLRGKFVWTNWDVEQLKAKAEEIKAGDMFTANIVGWPFKAL